MDLYQHFRPEERGFIDQVIDWKQYVENTYSPKLTDFLDPREQKILGLIIGENHDVKVSFFGGGQNTERKRAVLYPDYFQISQHDFQISLFNIVYPSKFVTIEHPQVLGSLMSLGLKRGKYGDILSDGLSVQFFAAEEIANYLCMELKSIGRATIAVENIPLDQAILVQSQFQEKAVTVSAVRIDAIVSAVFQIARQKAQTVIRHGLVKVNWTVIESPSFECGEGDMISVRGYGRVQVQTIEGKTKKDKWRIITKLQK